LLLALKVDRVVESIDVVENGIRCYGFELGKEIGVGMFSRKETLDVRMCRKSEFKRKNRLTFDFIFLSKVR